MIWCAVPADVSTPGYDTGIAVVPDNTNLGMATLADINQFPPRLLVAAQRLINGFEPEALSATIPINVRVDYYGLYTFGVAGNPTQAAMTPAPASDLLDFYCTDTPFAVLMLIGFAPFGASGNTSAYFSDFPNCIFE